MPIVLENAKIIINDQLRPVTDLYKDFFNDSDRENKIEKFKLFTASNRDSDIEYFKKLYLDTVQRKNGKISDTESICHTMCTINDFVRLFAKK